MNTRGIRNRFRELFGQEFRVYTAPGRINLIGEHTDYNGGYVFPGAIDKGIYAAINPNGLDKIRVFSEDYKEMAEFGMREEDAPKEAWARYIFGVVREMQKRGYEPKCFDAVFEGDVPVGAGMSSSAALECAFAYGLNDIYKLGIKKMELARIGQATEHNYCGVKCGIMDQFASLFGKKGHLVRLNCATMEYEYFPFEPKGFRLVLLDTKVKHELASSAYNKRRESCENVCAQIAARHPEVKYLSDATMDMLKEVKSKISEEDYLRAKYVIEEKQRVLTVCDALKAGEYGTVGMCMYETHYGLSKEYEVSCAELDSLVSMAQAIDVTGARVMGGGFGGCTINLVWKGVYGDFIDMVQTLYKKRYGHEPEVYNVKIGDGARKLR